MTILDSIKQQLTDNGVTAQEKADVAILEAYKEELWRDVWPEGSGGYDPTHIDALTVVGNTVYRDGSPFRLVGVSLASVNPNWSPGTTEIQLLDQLAADTDYADCNVVRIPIHKGHWDSFTDKAAFVSSRLDPVVQHALSLGYYVIIDCHPIIDWDTRGAKYWVQDFWAVIAPLYNNNPKILYEFFNEPVGPTGSTLQDWIKFRDYYQGTIDMIRSFAPNTPIIIGNPSWSTRIKHAGVEPFSGINLIYCYHIYPNQGTSGVDTYLDAQIPTDIPVFITEFGYSTGTSNVVTELSNNTGYPAEMAAWLGQNKHVNWTAWCWDVESVPPMLHSTGDGMKQWVATLFGTDAALPPGGITYTDIPGLTYLRETSNTYTGTNFTALDETIINASEFSLFVVFSSSSTTQRQGLINGFHAGSVRWGIEIKANISQIKFDVNGSTINLSYTPDTNSHFIGLSLKNGVMTAYYDGVTQTLGGVTGAALDSLVEGKLDGGAQYLIGTVDKVVTYSTCPSSNDVMLLRDLMTGN